MITILAKDGLLVVRAAKGDLGPRHFSQLAYWGFRVSGQGDELVSAPCDLGDLAMRVTRYFERYDLSPQLDTVVHDLLQTRELSKTEVEIARSNGEQLKQGKIAPHEVEQFRLFLQKSVFRQLRDHQIKAALHLLVVGNGANFSVPGSGKTTVVLSVFQHLKEKGEVDSLFVVGPPSCFGPWRDEFEETLGHPPESITLAGGSVDDRQNKYYAGANSAADLYLTSFHTFARDWRKVITLFKHQGLKFYFVVDEAHYIKQLGGVWASTVLNVANFAARRCILTGTPFPKDYSDAFNLFDFLWPESSPISRDDKHRIAIQAKKNQFDEASGILDKAVGGLFYRVRKSDLNLAPQVFHDPTVVQMNPHEKLIYDAILDKIVFESEQDYFRDLDLISRLRRGRMMRLRQCLSYAHLLTSAIPGYEENLIEHDRSLENTIQHYDKLETPGKLQALNTIVHELQKKGQKVVIWSNFVGTLHLLKRTYTSKGFRAELIYGATPVEQASDDREEATREMIIKEFVHDDSGLDILVANPAACAESISLHRTCSHAIYYDLSYNCAQYLQSLDRIHRVGGSEYKPSFYHFLQYANSLDQDVLANVRGKAKRMSQIVDQDYPIYSLDMFNEDDELAAYDRLFGGN